MFTNLKLSQKGIILIAVPLCFELIFISVLSWTLLQSQEALRQAERSKKILSSIEMVGYKTMLEAACATGAFVITRNVEWGVRYQVAFERYQKELSWLEDVVSGEPEQLKRVRRLQQLGRSAAEFGGQWQAIELRGIVRNQNLAPFSFIRRRLATLLRAMGMELQLITEHERRHRGDIAARQASLQETVRNILISGVSISILLSFGLVRFFNRTTSARLTTLMTNTSNLISREPLLPRMTGSDELAALDGSFHDMALSLMEMERFQNEVLAMVSHDLRGPLTSIKICMEMLSEGVRGPLPQGTIRDIDFAAKNSEVLISLVSDLLDVKQIEAGKLKLNRQTCNLVSLIETVITSNNDWDGRTKLELFVPDDTTTEIDKSRIEQVLSILLSHAFNCSPQNNTFSISLAKVERWLEVTIVSQCPGGSLSSAHESLTLSTRDSLRIAIAKAIIEAHGGTISGENAPGYSVSFKLPMTEG